jgi:hypothetical protein
LKATQSDLGKVTGSVNVAKAKLDLIADKLKAAGVVVRSSFTGLKKGMDQFATEISNAVKKFNNTAPGRVGGGLDQGAKLIGKIVDNLESIKGGLETIKAFSDAENGTGEDQIRSMKVVFDQLKSKLPIKGVPGLGTLLDAYSTAIGGIADSVGSIEKTLKSRIKMANEALRGTDFDDVDKLYPGLQSEREKQQVQIEALHDQKTALEAKLAAAGCGKAKDAAIVDPCVDPKGKPDQMRNLVEGMTAKEREAFVQKREVFRAALVELEKHAFTAPTWGPSTAETVLHAYYYRLAVIRRAVDSNDRSELEGKDPTNELVGIAKKLRLERRQSAETGVRRRASCWG